MSLDSFKADKPYKDDGEAISTERCAVQASNDISELIGEWPSEKQWNENKWQIGVSITYSDMLDKLDITEKELYLKAKAVPPEVDSTYCYNGRYKSFGDMYYAAAIFGPDFIDGHLSDHQSLVGSSALTRRTNMTLNEMKEYLPELDANQSVTSKSEVKKELKKLSESKGFPITMKDVNKYCSFSAGTVSKFSDDYTFTSGLKELDMYSYEQGGKKDINTGNNARYVRDRLEEVDGYDSNSSAYVYHLIFNSDNYGKFHYIGKVGNNSPLVGRLTTHINRNGQTRKKVIIDGNVVDTSEIDFEVVINDIISINSDTDDNEKINDKAKAVEDKKFKELCVNNNIDESKVIGGR